MLCIIIDFIECYRYSTFILANVNFITVITFKGDLFYINLSNMISVIELHICCEILMLDEICVAFFSVTWYVQHVLHRIYFILLELIFSQRQITP